MNSDDSREKDLETILELDEIVHSPARLSIMLFLLPRGKAPFTTIQRALGLSAGNLSSHVKKLQGKNLIKVEKAFIEAKPRTIIYLSDSGRKAVVEYASNLSTVLRNMLNETTN